ncbi:cysteine desulfurase family protein [Alkalicoccus urumqiensis]|uniref:Cysteine desulfurase NifS n=1 Tax=Alkalicoccus urumqiensis TaxID=1548213 RepID=A0A2P6MD95_ALKUR|nr:cysteine desulfurase family protein [Alkalicoccus urumqiensis]PRO64244.1 cysteine desulfurase NifS [Alkalicoccus urumqiensis]
MLIYLDNSASTRPHPECLEAYTKAASDYYANPASLHQAGGASEKLLEKARTRVMNLLGVKQGTIVFTSGATEANNHVFTGTSENRTRPGHAILTAVEHPSVKEAAAKLERKGWELTWIYPDDQGRIRPEDVEDEVTGKTALVSVMHVNNETGTIHPVEEIGKRLRRYPGVRFHVDGVQGIGKVPLSLEEAGIDYYSLSAHKMHGLKQSGILYVRSPETLAPLLHGGAQEKGLRAGTADPAAAAAFARALRMAKEEEEKKRRHLRGMMIQLEAELEKDDSCRLHRSPERAPHILSLSVPGRKPETVVHAMAEEGIILSTTSACSSKHSDRSAVLDAWGLPPSWSASSLRISLSTENTQKDIETFLHAWKRVIPSLAVSG